MNRVEDSTAFGSLYSRIRILFLIFKLISIQMNIELWTHWPQPRDIGILRTPQLVFSTRCQICMILYILANFVWIYNFKRLVIKLIVCYFNFYYRKISISHHL